MKKNNPHIPIMLREALGVEPRIYARYGIEPIQCKLQTTELTSLIRIRKGKVRVVGRYIGATSNGRMLANWHEGMDDKQIEDGVTGLVKNDASS